MKTVVQQAARAGLTAAVHTGSELRLCLTTRIQVAYELFYPLHVWNLYLEEAKYNSSLHSQNVIDSV